MMSVAPGRRHDAVPSRAATPSVRRSLVVFSGGKLEFRKGQDLVVAAFRRFHRRHPEALLVTCWQNSWPDLAGLIVAGCAAHAPEPRADHGIDVEGWMARMGLA